jgi:stage II sporulation protein GA (sporulation sigma-E factor processing peptidase)
LEYIYGDVLFVINFCMDFLSLYISGKLMHMKMSRLRLIIAATAGGIYGVVAVAYLSGIAEKAASLLLGIIVCMIAHYHKNIKRFAAVFALFFGVSLFMGGAMTFIYSNLGKYKNYIQVGGAIYTVLDDIPLYVFAIIAVASVLLSWIVGRIFSRKKHTAVCEAIVDFGGCMVDSGNLLCDPISGTPVMFISEKEKDIIPKALHEALDGKTDGLDFDIIRKLRFIPASTVAGSRVVVAAVPDTVYIKAGGTDYEAKKVYISVDRDGNDFGGYSGMVPLSLCN